jgi:hypothetical protein
MGAFLSNTNSDDIVVGLFRYLYGVVSMPSELKLILDQLKERICKRFKEEAIFATKRFN